MEGFQVSVVIPVRNEEATLAPLLESLRQQTFQPSEIIIVNGGSTDNTLAVAEEFAARDARVRVIDAGDATPGRGRNLGIDAARNEWVALVDAGTRAEPRWLERLTEAARRAKDVAVVYGNYEPVLDSFFKKCAALVYVPVKQMRDGRCLRGPSVASMLIRREVWRRAGGFPDFRAAEDLIFMEKVESLAVKTAWAHEATVRWQLQPTLSRTFKKFVLYSRHNVWAGRERFWHYGVARQYLLASLFIIAALFHSAWWLVALPLALALRTARSIWLRREGRGLLWALNPVQFLYVAVIILTIDAATFTGWAQALVLRAPDPVNREQATTGDINS